MRLSKYVLLSGVCAAADLLLGIQYPSSINLFSGSYAGADIGGLNAARRQRWPSSPMPVLLQIQDDSVSVELSVDPSFSLHDSVRPELNRDRLVGASANRIQSDLEERHGLAPFFKWVTAGRTLP